ncbi:hypothetical protein DYB26_001524 [Aphanomyces astaci]|uniref:Uncharacterized protein n=1 Tax=Aphanomyces astaci TaxID=112090 RepID=A0A3R6WRA2_APHAT|nr:hypothetical protein DYB26_001524 [Aphanomyces astaci]
MDGTVRIALTTHSNSTRQRKQLLKAPPERYRIETVSGYDLQKANKRRLMKAKADGTAAADDATADE